MRIEIVRNEDGTNRLTIKHDRGLGMKTVQIDHLKKAQIADIVEVEAGKRDAEYAELRAMKKARRAV